MPDPPSPPRFYGRHDDVFVVSLHEPPPSAVPEAFVQDLWLRRSYRPGALRTTRGAPVRVLAPGTHNAGAGPDFTDAHVRIGDVDWHGDVEVHTFSRGWNDHDHAADERYASVVLHVALYEDLWTGRLRRWDGHRLPEIVLAGALEASVARLARHMAALPAETMPCAGGWAAAPVDVRERWLDALGAERLRLRAAAARDADPLAQLHVRLFEALGYARNAAPMRELARRLPLHLLLGVDDPDDVAALHLGVAGLLPDARALARMARERADRAVALRDRFERLRHVRAVEPMAPGAWDTTRTRPANRPSVRVEQAAGMVAPGGLLRGGGLARLVQAASTASPRAALRRCLREANALGRPLGPARADRLLADAVVPVLLAGGVLTEARARSLLGVLPAPDDAVARHFAGLGTPPGTVWRAQGLHQLYKTRCLARRCLSCPIGRHLLDADALT